jgi:hypothetical protein
MLGRIGESVPYLLGIILLGESAGRADGGALSAGDTGSIVKRKVECLTYLGIKASVIGTDYRYILLSADCYAAAAEDTFIIVADKVSRAEIELVPGLGTAESGLVNTVVAAELLQFAIGGALAGKTAHIVNGEDKLKRGLSRFLDFIGICEDLHALSNRINAGGNLTETFAFICFNNTNTAGADFVDILHEAEGGNFNSRLTGGIKDG